MNTVLPGGTIGILGGGQLGRMLCLEARHMGYRTLVLDPTPNSPAVQTADDHIQSSLDNVDAVLELADRSDALTLEWELIPSQILEKIEAVKPIYPSSTVLGIIQDRLTQKEWLAKNNFPQTPFSAVESLSALKAGIKQLGTSGHLKRRRSGYDGKGQCFLAEAAAPPIGEILKAPCVLEAHVPFFKEISIILARGQDGAVMAYPTAENVHRDGILHTTLAPARISRAVQEKAERLAISIARSLGHVGVLAVEMFLLDNGELLINEIAPRVHNSGHYTLGACGTSQFEQHLRAVCGLPLADPSLLSPAVMVNLMGELWAEEQPRWEALLSYPQAHLHLYGKAKAAPGRKMGHILLLGQEAKVSLELADRIIDELSVKTAAHSGDCFSASCLS